MLGKVAWTLGVWAFCGIATVLVAAESKVGPVLHELDARHGVHLGDVVACITFPALATWLTWSFWRRP